MSKRSISTITSSTANRSHNHLPPTAAVVSTAQRVPGILSIAGLDLRPQPTGRKSKRKHPRAQDGLPTSASMPAALNNTTTSSTTQHGSAKSEFLSHPSGRLARARARAHSRTLVESVSASAALASPSNPNNNSNNDDPFLAPSAILPDPHTALLAAAVDDMNLFSSSNQSNSNPSPDSLPTISPRRRPLKSRGKDKAERNNRSKRKESKHMRSAMKERVADIPSDSAPEEMAIDLDDIHLSQPAPALLPAASSEEPSTPPAVVSSTSYDFPISGSTSAPLPGHSVTPPLGASAPIPVPLHAASAPHLPLAPPNPSPIGKPITSRPHQPYNRGRGNNSTPSTPPRASSIQPSASASASMTSRAMSVGIGAGAGAGAHHHPTHSRTHSHPTTPFLFSQFASSASAPTSPSQPLTFNGVGGARYANSAFQHSPSPNVLPKPKFLAEVFMEVDELL